MPVLDEAALARAAAAGDGQAFARLYDEYEGKIFNFCLRLVGSREDAADATQDAFVKVLQRLPKLDDRELNFGAYLFTAARNASYDLIGRRKRADPVELIPESGARPLSGDERGDMAIDPERAAMHTAFAQTVQAANAKLPERHREVLALRELEELSYDEIAEIMDMNRNAVAQLISRARIKLRDELRGTALESVATSGSDCERALPLIAMRQDGQLRSAADADWLDAHVPTCTTCKVGIEAMQEAGMSYRAWAPVLPFVWLWKSTAAQAAELTGSDWSELMDRPRELHSGFEGFASGADAATAGASGSRVRRAFNGRRVAGAAFVSLFVLLVVGTVALSTEDSPPADAVNAADTGALSGSTAASPVQPAARHKRRTKKVVVTHVRHTASGRTVTTRETLTVPVSDPRPAVRPHHTGTGVTHHTTGGPHTHTVPTATPPATSPPPADTPPAPATTPPADTTPVDPTTTATDPVTIVTRPTTTTPPPDKNPPPRPPTCTGPNCPGT